MVTERLVFTFQPLLSTTLNSTVATPTTMSGKISRSISTAGTGSGAGDAPTERESAPKRQHSPTASPLQVFVKAKKRINDIYDSIDSYVLDVVRFINSESLFIIFFISLSRSTTTDALKGLTQLSVRFELR